MPPQRGGDSRHSKPTIDLRPSTMPSTVRFEEIEFDRASSAHGPDPRSKIEVQPGSAAGAASGGECLTAACSRFWHGPGRRPAAARRLMNRIRFDSAVFERSTNTLCYTRGALSLLLGVQCKVYTRARAADPPRSLALQIISQITPRTARRRSPHRVKSFRFWLYGLRLFIH